MRRREFLVALGAACLTAPLLSTGPVWASPGLAGTWYCGNKTLSIDGGSAQRTGIKKRKTKKGKIKMKPKTRSGSVSWISRNQFEIQWPKARKLYTYDPSSDTITCYNKKGSPRTYTR